MSEDTCSKGPFSFRSETPKMLQNEAYVKFDASLEMPEIQASDWVKSYIEFDVSGMYLLV